MKKVKELTDNSSIRIGIVLTRLKAEKKKDELVALNSRSRPWLSPKTISRNMSITREGKRFTSADISVGKYIEWNYKNVIVDYIKPSDISVKRFHKNDLNFMLIYDLLESFHVDDKKVFEKFKQTLKTVNNVYPPYYYQKFVNNKCIYINHLSKLNDNVIPTFCIMSEQFQQKGIKWACNEIQTIAKKWDGRFIGKPVYGQESIDFKKFEMSDCESGELAKYMKKMFAKYPGVVFQKYIDGFDKDKPEIRVYFIDGKYRYSVITAGDRVSFPKSEGGYTVLKCHKDVINTAKNTIRKLPKIKIQGVELPHMLTRIDIATNKGGCGKSDENLISEIEFVPSLYCENIQTIPEPLLGDSMVKITNKFLKKLKN